MHDYKALKEFLKFYFCWDKYRKAFCMEMLRSFGVLIFTVLLSIEFCSIQVRAEIQKSQHGDDQCGK